MRELSRIEVAGLELLESVREAEQAAITERAKSFQEQSILADRTLTTIGLLGSEALRLYSTFKKRESYLMGPEKGPIVRDWIRAGGIFDSEGRAYDLAHERRVQKYAQGIVEAREGDISEESAYHWANQEIVRLRTLKDAQETLRRREGGGYRMAISASGYEYFSPSIHVSEPEFIEGIAISQQWRIKAALPCTYNGMKKILTSQHEYKQDDQREVTPIHTMILGEDGTVQDVIEHINDDRKRLVGSELFFPLGLLFAAREAVESSVPKKVSKKW